MVFKPHHFLYASRFFGDFSPIVPYLALYFSTHGLSVARVGLLFSVWALSTLAAEIPTGIIADRIDKKNILILAKIAKIGGFSIWLLSPTFSSFITGLILWGIGTALESGALQAFIYEALESENSQEEFQRIYSFSSTMSFVGLLAAAIVSACFVSYGYDKLIFISIASGILSILCLLGIKWRSSFSEGKGKISISQGLGQIFSARTILVAVLIGIAAGGIKGTLEEFYPVLLSDKHAPLYAIGIFIGGLEFMKILGSLHASRFRNGVLGQTLLLFAIGLSMVFAGTGNLLLTVIALALLTYADALLWIANDSYIQHKISKSRASVMSLKNFGIEFIAFIAFALTGFSGVQSVEFIYLVGGTTLICFGVIAYLFDKSALIYQVN